MSNTTEALRLARAALADSRFTAHPTTRKKCEAAITAIEAALSQEQMRQPALASPEPVQPVARVRIDSGEVHIVPLVRAAEFSPLYDGQKLYAAAPAQGGQPGEAA